MQERSCSRRATGAQHLSYSLPDRPHPWGGFDSLAVTTEYHRGQQVCGPEQPAEHWYSVNIGTARRYVIRSDGRRLIVDLLFPGDFFGFTCGEYYDFGVEAVCEGTHIASYRRRRIETLADGDPRLARELRQMIFNAMSRLQAQLLIVGRVTAVEKVGSFLIEMGHRQPKTRTHGIVLPISRYDIADYLAMSVETVSRSLTELQHRGAIELVGPREVRMIDCDALENCECVREHPKPNGARCPSHRASSTQRVEKVRTSVAH